MNDSKVPTKICIVDCFRGISITCHSSDRHCETAFVIIEGIGIEYTETQIDCIIGSTICVNGNFFRIGNIFSLKRGRSVVSQHHVVFLFRRFSLTSILGILRLEYSISANTGTFVVGTPLPETSRHQITEFSNSRHSPRFAEFLTGHIVIKLKLFPVVNGTIAVPVFRKIIRNIFRQLQFLSVLAPGIGTPTVK